MIHKYSNLVTVVRKASAGFRMFLSDNKFIEHIR